MNAESNGDRGRATGGAADGTVIGPAVPPDEGAAGGAGDDVLGDSDVARALDTEAHVSRAPDFIKASRPLHLTWKGGIFLIGLVIVVGGVIMLPLPGPGWLVIFAGMAVWATEFAWAHHVLRWTRRKVSEGWRRIRKRRS